MITDVFVEIYKNTTTNTKRDHWLYLQTTLDQINIIECMPQ